MSFDYYPKQTSWKIVNANTMNISHYIFRDIERTGNYDTLSKPMMKVAVKLTRPDGTYVVRRSNIQGFVNFTNSMIASPVDIWEPGIYKAEVMVPDGWEVTTGNSVQLLEFRENPLARAGIVVDSIPDPVGLAQILTIEGYVKSVDGLLKDLEIELIIISPSGKQQKVVTRDGYFKFNVVKGKWKLIVHLKGMQTVYEREIEVKTSPVKMSTIILGEEQKAQRKSSIHIVDFEELIPTEIRKMPNGVAGLNWKNLIITHHEYYNGEGYVNGLMSGKYIGSLALHKKCVCNLSKYS
ncbi:hypothetical protein P4479_16980, partial [Brevibacillus agri]|nr:hypothetical protein [Brevibacillus agri]